MATKKTVYEAPTPASDKKKALQTALAQIDKSFGKGTVMRLGDRPEMNVEAIPTGSLALDAALGIGGVPKGRIIEIYGPESSGKTTLALHILAEAQKRGGEVAFVDAEHALDPVYAAALGVDTDNLLVSQPDTGEQALEITDALVRSGAIDIVVIDSVAALVPKAEIDGESSAGRYSETLQEVTLYHSVRLYNDDVLRFATTQSSVWGMMLHMVGPCAVVVVLALVSAAVGSRFLAQVISADLMRIDLDRPLESDAPVELSPLLTRLDAQRKRLEAQASERRQYTANVSHELKTPLTVISGYAEIIAAGIAKDEDVKSFAHTIHSESQRMRSMVDDIISLSKLDDMGKDSTSGDDLGVDMNQVVSLESLANDVCGRLRPYAEDHAVSLSCEIERSGNEPVVVRGNAQILGEMVRNLAENAIRYNVEGGRAHVAIIGAADGSAVVRMSDTGIGIPPELRERVFERFFRVDESRSKETGGSGLGLAIVKHAAQVHGAKISVMGNEPQGTIIEVHFPAK